MSRKFLDAVEHAIQNELESDGIEAIQAMGYGYVAERICWRLRRDGFLAKESE